jgi:hypothetical protein
MTRAYLHNFTCVAAALLGLSASRSLALETTNQKSSATVQEDIGDIRAAEGQDGKATFRGTAQVGSQFVTNGRLLGNHSGADVLFLPTLEGGVNVPLNKQFSLDVMARAETVLYSHYDENAFFGFSGMATLDYTYKDRWPRLYAGVEPYWYQSLDTGNRISAANGFLGGIEYSHPFNRGRTLAYCGYKFTTYCTAPSLDSRNQHTVIVGVARQFQPSLVGQIYYSYQYSDYYHIDRGDSRNIVGVTLSKQWTGNFFTSFSAALVDNDSSQSLAQYQNFSSGLTFTYHF